MLIPHSEHFNSIQLESRIPAFLDTERFEHLTILSASRSLPWGVTAEPTSSEAEAGRSCSSQPRAPKKAGCKRNCGRCSRSQSQNGQEPSARSA